jgi:hypothetical protein
MQAHSKKIHTPAALGDHLEFVALRSALRADHVLADRVYSAVQRFCDGLTLRARKMKDRQQRQKKGLIEILSTKKVAIRSK